MTNKCIQGKYKVKSRDFKVVLLLCDKIVRRYVVLQTKYKVRWTIVLIHSAYENWVCHHFCLFVFCCMIVPVMGLLLHWFGGSAYDAMAVGVISFSTMSVQSDAVDLLLLNGVVGTVKADKNTFFLYCSKSNLANR